jgi:hypothetical protein
MTEEEEFRELELKQAQQRITKVAEIAADKFVANYRHGLECMSLHQAYKRGYRDALTDLMIKGKELL